MGIWTYIRNRVRDSFLAGAADALAEIEGTEPNAEPADILNKLRAKLQPALPAPAKLDPPADLVEKIAEASTEPAAEPATNGRSRKRS